MSEYRGGIFLGFSACAPKGLIPDWFYFSILCPSVPVNKNGSVNYAPCGIRKVEAALLKHGFEESEIVVAHPEYLDHVIGKDTQAVGITETDPLGLAPATSTFSQLFDGESYMSQKFRNLLKRLRTFNTGSRIIIGGPGAWQLEEERIRKNLGIDCIVLGESENVVGDLFERVCNNDPIPEIVHGEVVDTEDIPSIRKPTIDGIIEIARGCGRGCEFCVPTLQRYRCLPLESILKEVEVNLKAGRRPLLHAEDVLRYKARGFEVNKEAVIDLFKTVRNYPGVNTVAMSHFALSSVASAPEVVEEISNILEAGKNGRWLSGQTGLETGSPDLIEKNMKGKCKPYDPMDWPQVVKNAFEIMSENNWVPCATLIIGLPGETEKDIDLIINLLEELKQFKSLIVPLFLVSMGGLKDKTESFVIKNMTSKEAELFLKCWEHNISWSSTLLGEYFLTNSGVKGYALKFLLSYGIKHAKNLIERCKEEYNYDLATMLEDERKGLITVGPAPIRFIYKYLRNNKRSTF
ncbi:MAG: radical SAM protein [Candidatus Bathyarchaeota archaeon]